jgi:hypothetical protein
MNGTHILALALAAGIGCGPSGEPATPPPPLQPPTPGPTADSDAPVPDGFTGTQLAASAPAPAPSGPGVSNAAEVVAGMKSAFRACFNQGLDNNAELRGSVTLVARIGPNGQVLGVQGDSVELAAIVPCLKAAVASGAFSPPDNGTGATISIPLTFEVQR